jgi:hypothetical protein
MHSKFLAIASALVVMLAGPVAWAQSSTSERTPGHIMQRTPQAKSTGPGASEVRLSLSISIHAEP